MHPDTHERIRLKGSLYSREDFNARETAERRVIYGIPDPGHAAELSAQLEPMVAARARFHQQRYALAREDHEVQRDISLPGHTQEPLREYVERHLGTAALRSTWRPRRQRTGIANDRQGETGRGTDDRAGAAITRRLAAFGAALSGAGRRYLTALADLDVASGRLEHTSRAITASAAALDPWPERQWWEWFYGHDQGMEH